MITTNLLDPTNSLFTELDREGNTLLVAFGGISMGMGIPVFEFRRVTSNLPVKLAFIRDLSQAWYHGDLPGVGQGIEQVATTIKKLKRESGADRLVCIGNSMGGYASLVIGSLTEAERVIAFAPQTFIDFWLRIIHFDRRWIKQIRQARKSQSATKHAFDLKYFLAEPGYHQAVVFADKQNRLDAAHARRLIDVPKTEIRWVEGGHGLVVKLRDSGELERLLQDFCMNN